MEKRKVKLPETQPPARLPKRGDVLYPFRHHAHPAPHPAPPSKTMSTTYPYVAPVTQQLKWQGAELALAQLRIYLNEIKGELQPPRPDIISKAAEDGLKVVSLLEQWVAALPPGMA